MHRDKLEQIAGKLHAALKSRPELAERFHHKIRDWEVAASKGPTQAILPLRIDTAETFDEDRLYIAAACLHEFFYGPVSHLKPFESNSLEEYSNRPHDELKGGVVGVCWYGLQPPPFLQVARTGQNVVSYGGRESREAWLKYNFPVEYTPALESFVSDLSGKVCDTAHPNSQRKKRGPQAPRKWTEQRNAELLALTKEGLSRKEIARRLRTTPGGVSAQLHRLKACERAQKRKKKAN